MLISTYFLPMYRNSSICYSELGTPNKKYKDILKNYVLTCNIDHHKLAETPSDRVIWSHKIHQAISSFDWKKTLSYVEKRKRKIIAVPAITQIHKVVFTVTGDVYRRWALSVISVLIEKNLDNNVINVLMFIDV